VDDETSKCVLQIYKDISEHYSEIIQIEDFKELSITENAGLISETIKSDSIHVEKSDNSK
jgi:hypothetical protein